MVIDSTPFNNNEQDFTPFIGANTVFSTGFPSDQKVYAFLKDVDVVISCETFYNNNFTRIAKSMGVKTILQPNWEFFDWNLENHRLTYPLPDMLFVPSYWHLEDFTKFETAVMYMPPPIFVEEFQRVKTQQLKDFSKPRLLHNAGKIAHLDRNGTQSVIDSIKDVKGDFELVIKVQNSNGSQLASDDPRVTFDYSDVKNESDMYVGYDAMLLPRRYAGLCLPMIEALASGLPVVMTDIEPNNKVLPAEWLTKAKKVTTFMGRSEIDVYAADPKDFAKRISWMLKHLASEQPKAYNIAQRYSAETLLPEYIKAIEDVINN